MPSPGATGTVLVTGAGGLVGRALCARLAAEGQSVVGLDRLAVRADSTHVGYETLAGDLLDLPSLLSAISTASVESVVHAAAISHPTTSLGMPLATVQTNGVGTATLLEACRITHVRRFVFLSTECVYGDQPDASMTENANLAPRTPYAASKIYGESLCRVYGERWGLEQVCLRLTHVYGPGNVMPDGVGEMLWSGLTTGLVLIHYAAQCEQLLYVEDAVSAVILALGTSAFASPMYNIGPGSRIRTDDLADLICATMGWQAQLISTGTDAARDQLGILDCDLAARELGFSASTALVAGLASYAEWLRLSDKLVGAS